MEQFSTLWVVVFLIVVLSDVILWGLGFFLDVDQDNRFCLISAAAVLFYIGLAMVVGWAIAAAIWFAGLWLFAIIAGMGIAGEATE